MRAKSANSLVISQNGGLGGPSIQMEFPEARNFSVQFSVTNSKNAPTSLIPQLGPITPVGKVSWSLGGNQMERKVSVTGGNSITGLAEHVTASIFDETPLIATVPDTSNIMTYNGIVSMAEGMRGNSALPPYYQQWMVGSGFGGGSYYGTMIVPAANSTTVSIPKNIGVSSLLITVGTQGVTNPVGPLLSTQFAVVLVDSLAVQLQWYDPRGQGFIPLPSNASEISLTNLLTAGSIAFGIYFGIDG